MEGVKWMMGVVVSLSYTIRREGGRISKNDYHGLRVNSKVTKEISTLFP
jgi:hypothetical protein